MKSELEPTSSSFATVYGSPGQGPRTLGPLRVFWPLIPICLAAGWLLRAALPAPNLLARDGTPLTTAKHHDYGMAITFNFLDPAGNHLELVSYDHDQVRAGLAAA